MRKKYTEHEREIRERERAERSKNHEIRKLEKQTENDGKLEFLFLYWITSLVIKYVLPPFLKLFFKLIRNLIKSLLRKTFNFARLIFNFIFRPLPTIKNIFQPFLALEWLYHSIIYRLKIKDNNG